MSPLDSSNTAAFPFRSYESCQVARGPSLVEKRLLSERQVSVNRKSALIDWVWAGTVRPLPGSASPTANVATWWLAAVHRRKVLRLHNRLSFFEQDL